MKRIKEYLVDRNLETTKKILKEEMKIINNEIEKLTQNKYTYYNFIKHS